MRAVIACYLVGLRGDYLPTDTSMRLKYGHTMPAITNSGIGSLLILTLCLLGGFAPSATWAQIDPRDPRQAKPLPKPYPPGRYTCTAPTGPGTTHGNISVSQTWTAAANPHILPYDTNISATVTIEPCAIVLIGAGKTITIQSGGEFIAAGGRGLPVTIGALVPGSAWATIRNFDGNLSLTETIVRDGGFVPNNNANLAAVMGALQMQISAPVETLDLKKVKLHVENVEIANSRSQGVYINGNVGFDASSKNLRVYGSVGYPVHVYARVVGTVPTGNYTGNGRDAIAISGSGGAVFESQTMYDRGVPYHVGSGQDGGRMDIRLLNPAPNTWAVLTIEPGVTIQFAPGGMLHVDASAGGALVALGTSTRKIVFTSDRGAAAQAGDWLGIRFGSTAIPQSGLRFARVEFAGGTSPTGSNSCRYPGLANANNAAIRIYGPPTSQFVTETEVIHSAHHGIDRGWYGGSQMDFLTSNTFVGVMECNQTTNRTMAGACPVPVPCPK